MAFKLSLILRGKLPGGQWGLQMEDLQGESTVSYRERVGKNKDFFFFEDLSTLQTVDVATAWSW